MGASRMVSSMWVLLMGGPGGLGSPGGGVTGAAPPLRGVPEAVGCRQGGDFPLLSTPHVFFADCLLGCADIPHWAVKPPLAGLVKQSREIALKYKLEAKDE
jgi:hypothetical protein